jgi:hypothetical protein
MSEHFTWLAAMSMLGLPRSVRQDKHTQLANQICETLLSRWKPISTQYLEDGSDLTLAHYLTAVAVLVSSGRNLGPAANECLRSLGRKSIGGSKVSLSSIAALRIFQMFAVADKRAEFMFPVAFVNAECLQYFAGLLDPKAIRNRNRKIGAALQAWNYDAPTLRSVKGGVDKLAPKADKPIRSSSLSSVERYLLNTKLDLYDWRHPRMKPAKQSATKQLTLPWAALRGVSPDLHGPVLYALREQTRDPRRRRVLLQSLAECSGCWPVDLAKPDNTNERLSDTFLASVAHYADRFALVPVLFDGVKKGSVSADVGLVYGALSDLVASVTLGVTPMMRTIQRIKSFALAKPLKAR